MPVGVVTVDHRSAARLGTREPRADVYVYVFMFLHEYGHDHLIEKTGSYEIR